MEFIATPPPSFPKNLYPATAVITITSPEGPGGRRGSRRLSQGSQGSDEGGGALKRIISGGGQRRLSSFGRDAQPDAGSAVATGPDEEAKTGKFYWRVKVGVTDAHLVLVPDSPHSVLSPKPPTLTTDHRTIITPAAVNATPHEAPRSPTEEGITGKIKNIFRRSSVAPAISHDEASAADQAHKAEAPAAWPATVKGQPLQAIIVSFASIEPGKSLQLGTGDKKGEGSWVSININSHFSQFVHPMLESVGSKHNESWPKPGSIRFEFDKEWFGAKAEAEILHHQITMGIQNRANANAAGTGQEQGGGFNNPFAKNDTLQLGKQQQDVAPGQVAPAENVSVTGSSDVGKVPGERD